MSQPLNTNPYFLMDPEFALRRFAGTASPPLTLPTPLREMDEELAARTVARGLSQELPILACDVEQLWARIDQS